MEEMKVNSAPHMPRAGAMAELADTKGAALRSQSLSPSLLFPETPWKITESPGSSLSEGSTLSDGTSLVDEEVSGSWLDSVSTAEGKASGSELTVHYMSKDELRALGEKTGRNGESFFVIQGLGKVVSSELERRTKSQAVTISSMRQRIKELEASNESKTAVAAEQPMDDAHNKGLKAFKQETKVTNATKQKNQGAKETLKEPKEKKKMTKQEYDQACRALQRKIDEHKLERLARQEYLQFLVSNNKALRKENKAIKAELRAVDKELKELKLEKKKRAKALAAQKEVIDKSKRENKDLRETVKSKTELNAALMTRGAFLEKKLCDVDARSPLSSSMSTVVTPNPSPSSSYSSVTKSLVNSSPEPSSGRKLVARTAKARPLSVSPKLLFDAALPAHVDLYPSAPPSEVTWPVSAVKENAQPGKLMMD